ncbi:hypothetical protein GF407_00660 [candidate division KSB1 bacterium]|nr:hypothetical protein [candidate division KSB1 bacterium]
MAMESSTAGTIPCGITKRLPQAKGPAIWQGISTAMVMWMGKTMNSGIRPPKELVPLFLRYRKAEIKYYHLKSLHDDREYFPDYQAVYLYRQALEEKAPQFMTMIQPLAGTILQEEMIDMNAAVKLEGQTEDGLRQNLSTAILPSMSLFAAAVAAQYNSTPVSGHHIPERRHFSGHSARHYGLYIFPAGKNCSRYRRHYTGHPVAGSSCLYDSASRHRRSAGNCGAFFVQLVAHRAQYVYRDS